MILWWRFWKSICYGKWSDLKFYSITCNFLNAQNFYDISEYDFFISKQILSNNETVVSLIK